MRRIPFFNYPLLYQKRAKEYLDIINDVCTKGAFIMQEELFSFEKNLAKYLGVKHAIGMADGTMAILASLVASGLKKGDEIIVPSHTFVASAAAIHHMGCTPILVDCKEDHLIDDQSIEELISDKTRAIMPVQLNGRVTNMLPILEIAQKHNLFIVEDSCQALGAKFKGQFAGTFGKAGTFSFFPAKTLGCFGDGGAAITNDDEIAGRIRTFRDHGRDPKDGVVKTFGFNARLDNLHAAILDYKLQFYDEEIARRREIASIYQENLKHNEGILLPPGPNSDSQHFDIYQNYEIEVENREALREFLTNRGIGTILQWGGYALHQFHNLKLHGNFSYTETMTKKFMLLPMHTMLTNDEVLYICEAINDFY